jgi:hypothetical protein
MGLLQKNRGSVLPGGGKTCRNNLQEIAAKSTARHFSEKMAAHQLILDHCSGNANTKSLYIERLLIPAVVPYDNVVNTITQSL